MSAHTTPIKRERYDASRYLDWDEIEHLLKGWAKAHGDFFTLERVGSSHHDKSIWLVTLSLGDKPLKERSLLWLDAGTHASEWTGVSALLYSLGEWCDACARGDEATMSWFERHGVVAIPCVSPDGYDALRSGAPYLRSSLRPPRHDAPRSGLEPGDVDGDGVVRWMRWRHPAGPLVEDEDVPLFMRPRTLDDDPGEAFFVCREGSFINWDGARWTSADLFYGVDLNRNFPGGWKPFSMFGMDSGAYSASEPESRAVLDAFARFPTIAAGLTYHTYTGCILTQPYSKDSPLGDQDLFVIQKLARDLIEETGYTLYKVYPDFQYRADKPTPGVWSDTMTSVFGVPGYTVEFWNPYRAAGVEVEKPAQFFTEPKAEIVRELVRFASTHDTKPWTPFSHPQLGDIEIGGIDYMRTIRNPPQASLRGECEVGHTMASRLMRALPDVRVTPRVEAMGGALYLISVMLENVGYLSTSSLTHATSANASPPCQVAVTFGEGASLHVSSKTAQRQHIEHMRGWGERLYEGGQHTIYPSLGNKSSRQEIAWIIEGEPGAELFVELSLGRAGRQVVHITLPSTQGEACV